MNQKEKTAISYKIYDALTECDSMGDALEILTDTVAATIVGNFETEADRALIMGACIKRLQQYKKQMQKRARE